jgi:PAS domain S-box-containing protein
LLFLSFTSVQNDRVQRIRGLRKKFRECDVRSEAVFGLTSAPSKVINSDLTILKVNQALTELLGYSKEELIGSQILDYACEEDKPHWHELQEAMWKKGKPNFKLDACIIRKDGINWLKEKKMILSALPAMS